jgi:hypothetical protein
VDGGAEYEAFLIVILPWNMDIVSTQSWFLKHFPPFEVSRINILLRRDSFSIVFKTERNKGMFPRGSMISSRVRPADKISTVI